MQMTFFELSRLYKATCKDEEHKMRFKNLPLHHECAPIISGKDITYSSDSTFGQLYETYYTLETELYHEKTDNEEQHEDNLLVVNFLEVQLRILRNLQLTINADILLMILEA